MCQSLALIMQHIALCATSAYLPVSLAAQMSRPDIMGRCGSNPTLPL